MNNKIKVGITIGDPRGIGPEICAKALCNAFNAIFVIYGKKTAFEEACTICNLHPKYEAFRDYEKPIAALRAATLDILDGKLDLIVTAPLSKEAAQAEIKYFTGHTEYLAQLSSIERATMMFVTNDFKVSLITTHIPLKDVSATITEDLLSLTLEQTHIGLKSLWKINNPRMAVCGINPHAGENGLFGNEEKDVIEPTIRRLNKNGFNLIGPFGADTILTPARRETYDAVVSCFHDQLLPAIKLQPDSVNVTLGLPFIRTSVDHGVAYDIYGKNLANPSSIMAAIRLGIKLASQEQ